MSVLILSWPVPVCGPFESPLAAILEYFCQFNSEGVLELFGTRGLQGRNRARDGVIWPRQNGATTSDGTGMSAGAGARKEETDREERSRRKESQAADACVIYEIKC